MGTAGGEPRVLLNALKPMLGVVGDIKTPQEVMRVVGMMKDAEKLMSRCVYLNILKATCRQAMQNEDKKETLHKFLATGGWGILNKWLMEFTKSENFPVLLELIEVLKVLPITVDLLKQGNTGKLMKSMTKLDHSDVKKNASGLIKQWKNMIRVRELKKKPGNENEIKGDANGKGEQDEKKRKLADPNSKQQVSDSSGFMNALNIASPPVKKKRRTSNDSNIKKATLPLDEILKNSTEESADTEEKAEPMESPEPPAEEEENSMFVFRSPAVEAANAALAEDNGNKVVIDEGSLARKKNKKKRNITWAPDDSLVQVSYFELLEGERKGSHAENFSQARQLELMLEKQAMRAVRRGEDRMVEKVEWRCLIPVDNAGVPNFMPGEKSREKFIQAEREKTVLAYIFLTKQSLPDNPSEPDFDPEEHNNRSHQPTIIPHDEERTILPPRKSSSKPVHQQSSMNSTTSIPSGPVSMSQTTQPKMNNNSVPDLVSPAVQNIMTQLLRNNNTNSTSMPNDPQQQPQPPQMNNNPNVPPPNAPPNMGPPSILGQPGMIPPMMRPPFPNAPPPNMNQQVPNNFMPNPPRDQTPSLMDAPTNIRGQGNRGGGPRFQGGRGFNHNGRGGGEAGFNAPGGPGPRPRWNGPNNQGPPPNKRNGSWDDSNYDNNFNGDNYNENYNDNYSNYNEKFDDYRAGPNENGNFGRPGPKDGFRNGGPRGRGGFGGRGDNHRGGRGGNRGRGNDRDRFSSNNDWNYDRNNGPRGDRRNGDWNNRDDRNYGHGSNRGRDHRNNGRDGSRSRDERGKGNRR